MENVGFIKNSRLIVFILIIFLVPKYSFSQYKFEKIREFYVNSLFSVDLIDYLPSHDLFLGYINKKSKGLEVALINEKGEIIISKNLQGEGPEQYATSLNGLGFSNDGNIWVLTTFNLLLYDQSLRLKEKLSFRPEKQIFIGGRTYLFQFFYKNSDVSNFNFLLNPSGVHNFMGLKEFKSRSLTEVYSTQSKSSYKVGPISERSITPKLRENMADVYFPIFTIDQSASPKIYLTSSIDDEITVIDLNTNEVLSKLKIEHGKFDFLDKSSLNIDDLPSEENITLAATNHNIFKLDNELTVLEYIREIPYGIYEQKIADNPYYHHFKDPSYHRMIVFDKSKQVSEDLAIPYGSIQIALPNNRFLVKIENQEEEEDFVRYGIYELSKTNR